jgi:hypothetical protein
MPPLSTVKVLLGKRSSQEMPPSPAVLFSIKKLTAIVYALSLSTSEEKAAQTSAKAAQQISNLLIIIAMFFYVILSDLP